MAVTLYKRGNTHTVRGVGCKLGKFPPDEIDSRLASGWFFSPEEAWEAHEEKPLDFKVLEIKEAKEVERAKADPALNLDDMSNKEIREAAKEAGIESWDTTRIKTLKAELS
jgi:8-oxo-dGTP pyrophosphatase MutT (NUDIX family)